MIISKSEQETKKHLQKLQSQNKIIGFVPTMGALHKGHISLVEKAKYECDIVVASIFVNPTQFNQLGDLNNYPRTFEADCKMLRNSGCDLVFAPEVSEIYSAGELELKRQNVLDKSWAMGKKVDFGDLETVMEGLHRPGHFNGVAQVVSKLFRILKPNKAYFGLKDFQQLAIIRSMVHQLEMGIEIVACPITREENGLAMSSRNIRLNAEEKELAPLISQILFKVKDLQYSKSIEEIKGFVQEEFKIRSQFELEYFEIADSNTLQPLTNLEIPHKVAFVAAKLGTVRLIDNIDLS